MMSIWNLQDKFHDSGSDAEREAVRQELRDAGANGVADTIRSKDDGGTDWRDEH